MPSVDLTSWPVHGLLAREGDEEYSRGKDKSRKGREKEQNYLDLQLT